MGKYFNDAMVEEVRENVGACNETSLLRFAVSEFMTGYTNPKGEVDIKKLSDKFGVVRERLAIEAQEAALAARKEALVAITKQKAK